MVLGPSARPYNSNLCAAKANNPQVDGAEGNPRGYPQGPRDFRCGGFWLLVVVILFMQTERGQVFQWPRLSSSDQRPRRSARPSRLEHDYLGNGGYQDRHMQDRHFPPGLKPRGPSFVNAYLSIPLCVVLAPFFLLISSVFCICIQVLFRGFKNLHLL